MRTPIIAGNWKMHNTVAASLELAEALKPLVANAKAQVVVCPVFTSLAAVKKALEGSAGTRISSGESGFSKGHILVSRPFTSMRAPIPRNIRSVWSRLSSGSRNVQTPSERSAASIMALLTCADATGDV